MQQEPGTGNAELLSRQNIVKGGAIRAISLPIWMGVTKLFMMIFIVHEEMENRIKAQSWLVVRLKLLKVDAVIIRNTRRIRVLLSSSYPYQALFTRVAFLLAPDYKNARMLPGVKIQNGGLWQRSQIIQNSF